MLKKKNNVLYFLVVSMVQLWNILSKSNCRSNHLRGCTRPALHQCVRDTWTWWRVWRNIRAGRVRARSDYTAADLPPQKPRDKPAPQYCSSLWIHPSTVWLIKQTQSWMLQHTTMWSSAQSLVIKLTCVWGLLSVEQFLYVPLCKGNKHIQNELLTVNIAPQCLVQETFIPVNWMILAEPTWSLRPSLTWHEATILCCLSNILGEKKSMQLDSIA